MNSKKARYVRYGGPDVLTIDDAPAPEPGPGRIRVRVRAAAVNAFDTKVRRGLFASADAPARPSGTGLELSGVVDALGPGVTGPEVGQEIFGRAVGGAAATYALAPADQVGAKPANLSFDEAASLSVAGETALRVLARLSVDKGQTLLIHAVAGGVGLMTAQLARLRGIDVVGTASARHHDFLRGLGVIPIAYGEGLAERVRSAVPNVDAVLDASGRDVLGVSIDLAGDAAKVITICDGRADEYGVCFSDGGDDGVPFPEFYATILPLIESGEIRMPIERAFPLERIADAHRLSEEGHLLGKIVVTIP